LVVSFCTLQIFLPGTIDFRKGGRNLPQRLAARRPLFGPYFWQAVSALDKRFQADNFVEGE
jgi:hypothetical protein